MSPLADDEMGKSVAIDMVRMLPSNAKEGTSSSSPPLVLLSTDDRALTATLPQWGGWKSDNSSHFARTFGTRSFYGGEAAQTRTSLIWPPPTRMTDDWHSCCS